MKDKIMFIIGWVWILALGLIGFILLPFLMVINKIINLSKGKKEVKRL